MLLGTEVQLEGGSAEGLATKQGRSGPRIGWTETGGRMVRRGLRPTAGGERMGEMGKADNACDEQNEKNANTGREHVHFT